MNMQILDFLFSNPAKNENITLESLNQYISLVDPDWISRIKPADPEHIEQLRALVKTIFNQDLPKSYEMYLQHMGKDDGGLVSSFFDPEEWNYFDSQRIGLWAKLDLEGRLKRSFGKYEFIQHWCWYEQALSLESVGFSGQTQNPEQIVVFKTTTLYHTSDTFTKILLSFVYRYILNHIRAQMDTACSIHNEDGIWGTFVYYTGISLCIPDTRNNCWDALDFSCFLENLKKRFNLEDAWFSCHTEPYSVNLIDRDYFSYELSRYIGFNESEQYFVYIKNYHSYISMRFLSRNNAIQKIINAVLQSTELELSSFTFGRWPDNSDQEEM